MGLVDLSPTSYALSTYRTETSCTTMGAGNNVTATTRVYNWCVANVCESAQKQNVHNMSLVAHLD